MLQRLKNLYYFLLDIATLRKGIKVRVNDFELRLPARYYKYFPAVYEPSNFSFFKRASKVGMTSLDVGAHIGLYSVFMQKISGGTVYSFEPAPSALPILRKTISLNKAENKIEVVAAAVSAKPGRASLRFDTQPASVSNSLVSYDRTATLSTCEVNVESIDDFVTQKKLQVDFIKIDAEGVELSVLKGARETLRTQCPAIILAIHPAAIAAQNENQEMIWDFLIAADYSIQYNGRPVLKKDFVEREELFDVHLVPLNKAVSQA